MEQHQMIKIDNLTTYQVEMLDHMWSLETYEEFQNWIDLLDDEDLILAQSLSQMVILAEVDTLLGDCKEAKEVLSKFVL
jgi:hypothetical protein